MGAGYLQSQLHCKTIFVQCIAIYFFKVKFCNNQEKFPHRTYLPSYEFDEDFQETDLPMNEKKILSSTRGLRPSPRPIFLKVPENTPMHPRRHHATNTKSKLLTDHY